MRRFIRLAFAIAVGVSLLSCKQLVTGKGEIITDNRTLNHFESVQLEASANAEIVNGNDYSIQIEGYENQVPLIETTVFNNKLTISTKKIFSLGDDKMKMRITTPVLNKITLSGAGNLKINAFHQSNMTIDLMGAGNVTFSGSDCDTIYATLSGAGNMFVNANNYLDARLNGVGNIEYSGDPTVRSKVSGIGKISKR